jgi:hypothetical protein
LGIGAGIAGALGGVLVGIFGFKIVFILVGIFTLISTGLLLLIQEEIMPSDKIFPHFPFFKSIFKP